MDSKPSPPPINGPGRPLDASKDAAILEATSTLLFSAGVRAVTMERVARLSGVSKATLYSRHADRDSLIAAAFERQSARFRQELMQHPHNQAEIAQSLEQLCVTILRFMTSPEHLQFMRALGATHDLPDALRNSIYQHGPGRTLDDVATWLGSLAEDRLIHCPDPVFSAELLLGMLQGYNVMKAMYHKDIVQEDTRLTERARQISSAFLRLHAPPA